MHLSAQMSDFLVDHNWSSNSMQMQSNANWYKCKNNQQRGECETELVYSAKTVCGRHSLTQKQSECMFCKQMQKNVMKMQIDITNGNV